MRNPLAKHLLEAVEEIVLGTLARVEVVAFLQRLESLLLFASERFGDVDGDIDN